MQKTHDEIKKGLECCMDHEGTCELCPYADGECRAFEQLSKDALALIQQLEAQNAKLSGEMGQLQAERDALMSQAKTAHLCELCKHFDTPVYMSPCVDCGKPEKNCWQWIGVK